MTKTFAKYLAGMTAAAATTFTLFSAVAKLADSDRATTLAAQIKPAQIAKVGR